MCLRAEERRANRDRQELKRSPRLELTKPTMRLSYTEARGVAQLGLERLVRDQEVVGSNPITPTFDNSFAESKLRLPAGVRWCGPRKLESW